MDKKERMGTKWLKAGFKRGVDKERCPLCLGEDDD
jgi:hypothetical protein